MTEGELYKRLEITKETLENYHSWELDKYILSVLEEMKKDVFQFDRTILELPQEEWSKFGVAAVNALLEINKKLVKWLGDKKW